MSLFANIIYSLPAVLIAIVFHEWAHAFVSYLLGDTTAKNQGRLSLNPFHHLDPIGVLFLLLFKVGWAKPVQINPYMYKNKKSGTALTALAGPIMNFIIAFIAIFIMGLIEKFFLTTYTYTIYFVYKLAINIAYINLGLGLFNLIPIPPLDGSKVLAAILPDSIYNNIMKYERYGFLVLVLFILFGFDSIIDPILEFMFNGMFTIVSSILKLNFI